jgi:hypothetical protein
MIIFSTKESKLDDILDRMAEQIQLDDTRYDKMKTSYNSIKTWLENDNLYFKTLDFDVYPHGSVRILTTVKPLKLDEFDLDIVIHFKSLISVSPHQLYNELKRSLTDYAERFGVKMEPKNRCIRLVYSGDYHVDVMPGIQLSSYNEKEIMVSDRKLMDWVISNPKGYAEWFYQRNDLVKESLLERTLKSENLPTNNFKFKKPLQRAVQLIKRYRDIYFQDNPSYKTSSVILTTIAGYSYNGEDSIFNSVDNIISKINSQHAQYTQHRKVLNPVNLNEDFTDKWKAEPEYFNSFKSFITHLYNHWQSLKIEYGLSNEGIILRSLFGEAVYNKAYSDQINTIIDYRNEKTSISNSGRGIDTGTTKDNENHLLIQSKIAPIIGNNKPYLYGKNSISK